MSDLTVELRVLRARAGNPSLRSIATMSGVGHSTIAALMSDGVTHPKWTTLNQVVTALKGDPAQFRALWEGARGNSTLDQVRADLWEVTQVLNRISERLGIGDADGG